MVERSAFPASLALSLLLAGCAAGPDYREPVLIRAAETNLSR